MQNDEFIAAGAGDNCRFTYSTSQSLSGLSQHLVANDVTMVIIDRLESVEVDKEKSKA